MIRPLEFQFWKSERLKVDTGTTTLPLPGAVSRQEVHLKSKREAVAAAYLRTAHAYMLISMPTGTSTIFGVFQAILAFLVKPDETHPPG
jgi:hypothetical protein